MKAMRPSTEVWNEEVAYARNRRDWLSFALELRACLRFLLASWEANQNSDAKIEGFFAYKFVRMLMGYSLENLLKGLLLSGPSAARYLSATRITFRRGHDLKWLCSELGVTIDPSDALYVEVWSVSAEWYGKYPFPQEMNRVLPQFQPLSSSAALSKRVLRGKRTVTLRDILHTGIGSHERERYETLFAELQSRYEPNA